MRVFQALFLMVSTACFAVTAVADDGDCVIGASETLANLSRSGILAQAPGSGEVPARVRFGCEGARINDLRVRLVPGDSAEVRIVLSGVPEQFARVSSQGGTPASWVQIDSRRIDDDTVLIALRIAPPESAPAETAHPAVVHLSPGAGGDSTFEIPLLLELEKGGSLFRDQYEIGPDPVIGQFSMAY